MKTLLMVLIIIISTLTACNHLRTSGNENAGGILIIYGDTTSTSNLELLETGLLINPTKKRYVKIKPLEPGYYSICIKGKPTEKGIFNRVVKNIKVTADSLSIFPLLYFELFNKSKNTTDTLTWGMKKHWYQKRKTHLLEFASGIKSGLYTKTLTDGTVVPDTLYLLPLSKRIKMCDKLLTSNLSGRVFSDCNQPIKNGNVRLAWWWSTHTAKDGFYRFNNVLSGIYQLSASTSMSGRDQVMPYPTEVNLVKDISHIVDLRLTDWLDYQTLE